MLTDRSPRKKNREFFVPSDRLKTLALPGDLRLPRIAGAIELVVSAEGVEPSTYGLRVHCSTN